MLICLENLVMEPQQRKFAKEGLQNTSYLTVPTIFRQKMVMDQDFTQPIPVPWMIPAFPIGGPETEILTAFPTELKIKTDSRG